MPTQEGQTLNGYAHFESLLPSLSICLLVVRRQPPTVYIIIFCSIFSPPNTQPTLTIYLPSLVLIIPSPPPNCH